MKKNINHKKDINAISWNDQRMQSMDLIETYAYGTYKDLVSEKNKTTQKWYPWCYKKT